MERPQHPMPSYRRVCAGHYTREGTVRLRDREGNARHERVLIRIQCVPEWPVADQWSLEITTLPPEGGRAITLVGSSDAIGRRLVDLKAQVEVLLQEGFWEYRRGLGWCWIKGDPQCDPQTSG